MQHSRRKVGERSNRLCESPMKLEDNQYNAMDEGTVAATGIITTDNTRKKFVASFWNLETSIFCEAKISTISKFKSPSETGKIHVESGAVRSVNHNVPPVENCSLTSEFKAPTLQLRKARDTKTHIGICTHTSKVALKGWQLSRMYSSVIILRRFLLK